MNNIRKIRTEKGISAQQLADRVGTSPTQIRRLEIGTRRLTTDWMTRIADAIGCSAIDLMSVPYGMLQPDVRPVEIENLAVEQALKSKQIQTYKVLSDALSEIGILPDQVLVVDCSADAIASVKDGDVVVAQRSIDGLLVMRQHLSPQLLTTNRRQGNVAATASDPANALQIVGVAVLPRIQKQR